MKTITHTISATSKGFTQTLKVDDQVFTQTWTQDNTGAMRAIDGASLSSDHEAFTNILETINSPFIGMDLFTLVKESQDGKE